MMLVDVQLEEMGCRELESTGLGDIKRKKQRKGRINNHCKPKTEKETLKLTQSTHLRPVCLHGLLGYIC